jgi:hypothetical protein
MRYMRCTAWRVAAAAKAMGSQRKATLGSSEPPAARAQREDVYEHSERTCTSTARGRVRARREDVYEHGERAAGRQGGVAGRASGAAVLAVLAVLAG